MNSSPGGRSTGRFHVSKRDEIWMNCHRALLLCFEHDLFGKPLHTFPDHALVPKIRAARSGDTADFEVAARHSGIVGIGIAVVALDAFADGMPEAPAM